MDEDDLTKEQRSLLGKIRTRKAIVLRAAPAPEERVKQPGGATAARRRRPQHQHGHYAGCAGWQLEYSICATSTSIH